MRLVPELLDMPIIAVFLGITVRVFHADHAPPHIHVQYDEDDAVLAIRSGRVLGGRLSRRVLRLAREWLSANRPDILTAWEDAQRMQTPRRIRPLE